MNKTKQIKIGILKKVLEEEENQFKMKTPNPIRGWKTLVPKPNLRFWRKYWLPKIGSKAGSNVVLYEIDSYLGTSLPKRFSGFSKIIMMYKPIYLGVITSTCQKLWLKTNSKLVYTNYTPLFGKASKDGRLLSQTLFNRTWVIIGLTRI